MNNIAHFKTEIVSGVVAGITLFGILKTWFPELITKQKIISKVYLKEVQQTFDIQENEKQSKLLQIKKQKQQSQLSQLPLIKEEEEEESKQNSSVEDNEIQSIENIDIQKGLNNEINIKDISINETSKCVEKEIVEVNGLKEKEIEEQQVNGQKQEKVKEKEQINGLEQKEKKQRNGKQKKRKDVEIVKEAKVDDIFNEVSKTVFGKNNKELKQQQKVKKRQSKSLNKEANKLKFIPRYEKGQLSFQSIQKIFGIVSTYATPRYIKRLNDYRNTRRELKNKEYLKEFQLAQQFLNDLDLDLQYSIKDVCDLIEISVQEFEAALTFYNQNSYYEEQILILQTQLFEKLKYIAGKRKFLVYTVKQALKCSIKYIQHDLNKYNIIIKKYKKQQKVNQEISSLCIQNKIFDYIYKLHGMEEEDLIFNISSLQTDQSSYSNKIDYAEIVGLLNRQQQGLMAKLEELKKIFY